MFVPTFTTVTSAFGITAPVGSLTTPEIDPVTLPQAEAAIPVSSTTPDIHRLKVHIFHLPKMLPTPTAAYAGIRRNGSGESALEVPRPRADAISYRKLKPPVRFRNPSGGPFEMAADDAVLD